MFNIFPSEQMHLHVQGLQEDGGQVSGVSVLLHERSQHGLHQPDRGVPG